MSRCLNKPRFLLVLIFLPFSFLVCCALVDLRSIGISTVPESAWALLPEEESPVIVRFDTEMEKSGAEKALQVYSSGGVTDGDLRWEGTNLYFVPSVPWRPGIRYGMRLSGNVSAKDGRENLLSMDIPFYAVSRTSLPYVKSYYPADGISVGVSGPTILEMNFSDSMDTRSTAEALKIDIPGERIDEWYDDNRTLRITSDKPLNPWVVYKWSLSDKALSREGAPLAKDVSGRFITDLDREFISVVRVVPLMPPEPFPFENPLWGSWTMAAPDMRQGHGYGQGIGVEFSKEAESDSLRRSFSFVPPLPGRVEILSPYSAVYIPSKDPEPETVYTMRISGTLKDREGLKMGNDFTITYQADIPFLRVISFSSAGNAARLPPESDSVIPATVITGGIIQCFIHFSLPFDSANPAVREDCAFKISLRPFFPNSLPPVSLRTVRWLSSDRLQIEWEGPEGGFLNEPHYYKLTIPGGSGGVHNGQGSFLKNDFVLYLEAKE